MPPVRYVRDGGGTAGAGRFLAHARVTWSSPGHQIPPREPGIWIRPPALIRPSSWPCPARHVTVVLVAAPNSCVASPAPSVLAAGNRSNRRPETTSPCRSPPLIFPVIISNPSGALSQPLQRACIAARTFSPPPSRPSGRAVACATSSRCRDSAKRESLIPPQPSPAS